MLQRVGCRARCLVVATALVALTGCGFTTGPGNAEEIARKACTLVEDMNSGRAPLSKEREAFDLAARADRLDPKWHFLYAARKRYLAAESKVPKTTGGGYYATAIEQTPDMDHEDAICPKLASPLARVTSP
jgi:hypothetical protein